LYFAGTVPRPEGPRPSIGAGGGINFLQESPPRES
jgi:hypothetical protein